MGYYGGMGDYYPGRGRGDPLFGMLAPLAGGLIKKGVGALAGRLGRGAAVPAIAAAAGIAGGTMRGLSIPAGGGFRINPMSALPGGQPLITGGSCEPGYHLAKDGSGKCVRNRHMNPTNPKALRRAIRRQQGFIQLAQRMGMTMRTKKVLSPRKKARR